MGFELESETSTEVTWARPLTCKTGIYNAISCPPVTGGKLVLPSRRPPAIVKELPVGPAKLLAITGAPMTMLPAASEDRNGTVGPVSTVTDEGNIPGASGGGGTKSLQGVVI